MIAKIFIPQTSAMQSGPSKPNQWVLTFERQALKFRDPLMGWYGNKETNQQIHLNFDSLDEAKAYASKEGLPYRVISCDKAKPKSSSYADNFAQSRKQAWTH